MRLEGDTASRLGGDEFVVVLDGMHDDADAARVAERLLARIAEPIDLGVQHVALSASIGISIGTCGDRTAEELLREADTAMYRAKASRAGFAVFDPAMHDAARRRLAIESDLRRAVAAHHFSLVFQPIVHAASGRIAALEALVRWDHPDYPRRTPNEFIPVAEQTGLIVPLGEWLLEQACSALASLRAECPGADELRINVNLSRRQLLDPRLGETVRGAIRRTGVPASRVALEITESAIIEDVPAALARLGELRSFGLGLQLDDFGTGYSSLSCLQRFPLDVVKIDRAFVAELGRSERSAAIVESVVLLAHRLGMHVTVEGVETAAQLDAVRAIGGDFAQGYLIQRPMPLDGVRRLLAAEGERAAADAARASGLPIG
jgi:predicted signal transduction protein with EAL and GGDEF domain